ncbi:MAG: hypothetical protein Q9213_006080 [Squamulea squamosa]
MTDGHNDVHESVTPVEGEQDYTQWSSAKLLERVTALEKELRDQTARSTLVLPPSARIASYMFDRYELLAQKRRTPSLAHQPKRSRSTRQFDPSKYSTRLIALKFAYLGQRYNGLEYHANNNTRFPTIEEEMWKALDKAKLIFPAPNTALKEGEPNWEGCDYSKSGRTDKGVSAFGQVIGIRVRSNRPLEKQAIEELALNDGKDAQQDGSESEAEDDTLVLERAAFDHVKDEIPYPQILNRLLPPEIRVLAWCPSPPVEFSARFSCGERCYKYFFTQPAFWPTIGTEGLRPDRDLGGREQEGWLDIEAMREASRKFEGSYDFRNFCKVDPSKQIDNFTRMINRSEIVEVKSGDGEPKGSLGLPEFQQFYPPSLQATSASTNGQHADEAAPPVLQTSPKIYAYKVRGSGFLWHQVRHMVAILFLIGQGLERPSIIDDLLDVEKHPGKPTYDMADAAPLVLEECNFPDVGLQWVHVGDYTGNEAGIRKSGGKSDGKHGLGGTVDELWRVWHKHKIDETLASSLLSRVVREHRDVPAADRSEGGSGKSHNCAMNLDSQKVYQGGDVARLVGRYTPILERPRMETVDAINAKYLQRKGLDPPIRNGARSSMVE